MHQNFSFYNDCQLIKKQHNITETS